MRVAPKLVGFDPAHRVSCIPGRMGIGVSIASLPVASMRELANLRQTLEDLFPAEMAQVEEYATVDPAPLEISVPLGPA